MENYTAEVFVNSVIISSSQYTYTKQVLVWLKAAPRPRLTSFSKPETEGTRNYFRCNLWARWPLEVVSNCWNHLVSKTPKSVGHLLADRRPIPKILFELRFGTPFEPSVQECRTFKAKLSVIKYSKAFPRHQLPTTDLRRCRFLEIGTIDG